eukprot:TRINITY_DN663_c0_g1_i3.p1 TRINITY_DN663_c0_g1~~TRINITY_DN663_c0_g1_i3.p1  ORF type:complete len:354 (+),score=129.77 TRINITY_DN663_c0_g1_i3:133-1194(+)
MIKLIALICLFATVVIGQSEYTQINIIQFSDNYCLCPNQQRISLVDECLPVLGGYQVYRLVDGTPDQVVIQNCADKQCKTCVNTTTYNTLPPCQSGSDGSFYSVLPENDVQTYYNAPSVITLRYNTSDCNDEDVVHMDIDYGLSCFKTAEGGSFYYECPTGITTEYYAYNCSDDSCLDCVASVIPTETCTNDEGVYKSVQCSATSTSTSATSQTATSQTATSDSNTVANAASATVSTTTSASSHNVSSSASAANSASASATSGGSVNNLIYNNDVRGGHMRGGQKNTRSNPPFCNGGLPVTTTTSTSADGTSVSAATSASGTQTSSFTSGTSGGNSASATGGSSGGSKIKISK